MKATILKAIQTAPDACDEDTLAEAIFEAVKGKVAAEFLPLEFHNDKRNEIFNAFERLFPRAIVE